jgi:hypothetical protein
VAIRAVLQIAGDDQLIPGQLDADVVLLHLGQTHLHHVRVVGLPPVGQRRQAWPDGRHPPPQAADIS